jgi:O-succinylbenzoate synthase
LKIERVVITHVRVPLVEPFRISSGAISEKDGIVVALHSDGVVGYGESSPMAGTFYSNDTPEASWAELSEIIAPAIVGRDFEGPEDWNRALDALLLSPFTKAGVETAFWDLAAQTRNQPLHELLGGTRTCVESGLAVGLYENVSHLLRTVARHLEAGYRRVKLKIEPGRDVKVVKAVRKEFVGIPMSVDANGAYTLRDRDVFRALDDLDLTMFEQPFPASFLEEMAELQRQVRIAIELGSLRIANFKIQRVGGFYRALEMDAICREHSIRAWVGTMPELGVGQAQGAALASLCNFVYPTDVEASERWFCDDIICPFIQVKGGNIQLPESPGLGYTVDHAKIQKYKIASRRFPE